MLLSSFRLTAAAIFGIVSPLLAQNSTSLPIVDLGYQRHQASYNSTGRYYTFSNIRYAAPPLGELRFAAPQPPTVNRSHVDTGDTERICPQAYPAWNSIVAEFLPLYLGGQTVFNSSSFASTTNTSSASTPDPRVSEDCLFLDVVVPEDIFLSNEPHPVLVWIYGGGYTQGSKSASGNPAGLIARSESNNSTGVIYVSMNYRLGAFGWLSGPTFQEHGTANAGLYDQRFALEWVQNNIHLFGGDPARTYVFGESAGAGSIEHHITAYGGNRGPAPFTGAVLQSPGFFPVVSAAVQESTFQNFLSLLNVSTLEEARKLPSSTLQVANLQQIGAATYGQFTYGPVVDGDYVPALPGQLLLHGQYDKTLQILTGHNDNEGLIFTSPFAQNDSFIRESLTSSLPSLGAMPSTLDYILNTLYPPIFDGSQAQNYTNQIGRTAAILSELIFTCNTYWLHQSYNNTYGYLFNVPTSVHGQDIAYTYYNGNGSADAAQGGNNGVTAPQIALVLQEYITQFAKTANPNQRGAPFFPAYGSNSTVQVLGPTTVTPGRDPAANARCDWWQKGLWY